MSNVRAGDMAMVVRTGAYTKSTLGAVVHVLCRLPDAPHQFDPAGIRWDYEPHLANDFGVEIEVMNDCCLRPIRADGITSDEVDELFTPDELAFITTGERG